MSADIAALLSMSAVLRQVTSQAVDDSEFAYSTLRELARETPAVTADDDAQLSRVIGLAESAVTRGAACAELADHVALAVASLRRALADYCDAVQAADRLAPVHDDDMPPDFGNVIAFPGLEGLSTGGIDTDGAGSIAEPDQSRADQMRQDASESLRRQCLAIAADLETARHKYRATGSGTG